jgi:hypothetical protein
MCHAGTKALRVGDSPVCHYRVVEVLAIDLQRTTLAQFRAVQRHLDRRPLTAMRQLRAPHGPFARERAGYATPSGGSGGHSGASPIWEFEKPLREKLTKLDFGKIPTMPTNAHRDDSGTPVAGWF